MDRPKTKHTVQFSINLREDAANWVRLGKMKNAPYGRRGGDFSSEILKPILQEIRRLPRQKAIRFVFQHLRKHQDTFIVNLRAMKAILEVLMEKHGDGLLRTVAALTDRPLYTKTFYATFTLLWICPYNPDRNWFMISAKRNIAEQLNTIAHEILHLQFIHYYYRYCLKHGLTESQFQDLKESLTVFLNGREFRKYHLALDVGYPNHQALRAQLPRLRSRSRSFTSFLDRAILLTAKLRPAPGSTNRTKQR